MKMTGLPSVCYAIVAALLCPAVLSFCGH